MIAHRINDLIQYFENKEPDDGAMDRIDERGEEREQDGDGGDGFGGVADMERDMDEFEKEMGTFGGDMDTDRMAAMMANMELS